MTDLSVCEGANATRRRAAAPETFSRIHHGEHDAGAVRGGAGLQPTERRRRRTRSPSDTLIYRLK